MNGSAGYARTLAEARLYVDLTTERPGTPTTLEEGPTAWTVRFEMPDSAPAGIAVPYRTEMLARRDGQVFGPGRSRVIDCGQWRLAATVYARRALEADLLFAESPDDEELYEEVVDNWELAAASVGEAAKFLPDGAGGTDEPPPAVFWTDMGEQARRTDPGRFTRDALSADLDFYRMNRDDFVALYDR